MGSKKDEREKQSISGDDVGQVLDPQAGGEEDPNGKAEETLPKTPEEPEKTPEPSLPTITVAAFAKRFLKQDPITIAFVSCEGRTNGVRKLSEPEWRELHEQFLSAPR